MQVFKPSTEIQRANFHLLNWPDFLGSQDFILETGSDLLPWSKRCGRIALDVDGWSITVNATDLTDSSVQSVKEIGGYKITHVGEIQRADGTAFKTEELDEVLGMLSYFFSFTLGKWSSPCLTVGFDSGGIRCYEEWGLRRSDEGAWSGDSTWFDEHHAEMMNAVMPGFFKLWSSTVWKKPLTEALYWYILANRGGFGLGVDSALLFTQSALETLSWTYCVLDRKMVSAGAFKPRGLIAADKLRLLASALNIPLEIPSTLPRLLSRPGKKWDDSMDSLTDLRNRLVHPDIDHSVPDGIYFDAWRLSMWYLDLILLRLCNYNGDYSNRLSQRFTGQVENVPWI